MINTAVLSVSEGYVSRSWRCMFCPHGQGRHHNASSGHKWTCLFWLVQRIINPSPQPSLPPRLNKSEWLAAPVNVITYQSEIMSHPPTPRAAISLERSVGVFGRDTFRFDRTETTASMQGDWPVSCDESLQILSLCESNGDGDLKPEGTLCFCDLYIFMLVTAQTTLKKTENS